MTTSFMVGFFASLIFMVIKGDFIWFLPIIIGLIGVFIHTWQIGGVCGEDHVHGSKILNSIYYEEWDEWVPDIVKEPIKDSNGITIGYNEIDKGRVVKHDKCYTIYTDEHKEHEVPKFVYNECVMKFGSTKFRKLYRKFHEQDGNCYITQWDYSSEKQMPYFYTKYFINQIKHSYDVHNKIDLTTNLYQYFDYPTVMCTMTPFIQADKEINLKLKDVYEKINIVNSNIGVLHNVSVNILLMYDSPIDRAIKQGIKWKNGNSNEFNIVLGLKSLSNGSYVVEWVHFITWFNDVYFQDSVKQIFIDKSIDDAHDLIIMLDQLNHVFDKKFKKQDMLKHYDYIHIRPKWYVVILIVIISSLCLVI